jgi:hypothetical protein
VSTGHSYATVSVRPGEPTGVRVSFCLDELACIEVYGAGTKDAHLYISHGDTSAAFGPASKQVTEQDVQLARTLAEAAAVYAAEVGRLKAEQDASAEASTAA